MATENTPKLNLSALLKKESENQTPQVTWVLPESPVEVEKKAWIEENPAPAILNPGIFPEKKVVINIPEAKAEENNIMISAWTPLNTQENIGWEIIWWKINFLALQKNRTEEGEKDKQAKLDIKNNEAPLPVVKEKVELFWNYKPSFEWRAKKFFDQIRQLRLKARTHIRALTFLCVLTWWIVGWAFYFFPEKHSVDIYKANIMALFSKKNTESNDIIPEDILPDNLPTNSEVDSNVDNNIVSSWETSLSWTWNIIESPKEEVLPIIEIPKTEEGKKILRNEALKKYFLK